MPNIEEKNACVTPLTFEKENVILYIGDYVLKSLTEEETDEELLHGFNCLIDTSKGIKSNSYIWIKKLNKKG